MKEGSTAAGMRYNTVIIEEWTKIVSSASGEEALKQFLTRVTKPSWNQHHPIWGNHILQTATAKTPGNATSWEFFDTLLATANVVVTPGSGFGAAGEGYFRISAFNSRQNVEEAMQRLRAALR